MMNPAFTQVNVACVMVNRHDVRSFKPPARSLHHDIFQMA